MTKLDVTLLKRGAFGGKSGEDIPEMPGSNISSRIGFQLKRKRLLKGIRLKDVAEATSLSQSLISKIENNKVSPSLSTLHKLVKVLGTSISALFAIDETLGQVVHRPNQRPIAGKTPIMTEWDGIETEIMAPYEDARLLEGSLFVMEPSGHSGGVFQHEGEECGYVLEGQLELSVCEETYFLDPGVSFFSTPISPTPTVILARRWCGLSGSTDHLPFEWDAPRPTTSFDEGNQPHGYDSGEYGHQNQRQR